MTVVRRVRALTAAARRAPAPALLLVSTLGWAAMVWLAAAGAAHTGLGHGGHAMAGHAGHIVAGVAGTAAEPSELAVWMAMVAAMSPLLLFREVARLQRGTLRRQRGVTILVFASGYAVVWASAGLVAVPLAGLLADDSWAGWLAVALAAVWQCSPLRQRFLNACHRAPRLRVFGAPAKADAWRYGAATGTACAATCGPLMLLVMLSSGFHFAAMVLATLLLTVERYQPARRPRWRMPFIRSAPEHAGLTARGPTPAREVRVA